MPYMYILKISTGLVWSYYNTGLVGITIWSYYNTSMV
jgi:hypothetical protein